MRRPQFIALVWPPEDDDARARVETLARRIEGEGGWFRAGRSDRLRLWTDRDPGGAVYALPELAGFVIGEIFPRPANADVSGRCEGGRSWRTPVDTARRLSQSHWGSYVALLHGPSPASTAAFRDPSGQLDCLTWSLAGRLEVVASNLRILPSWLRPPRLTLNWDRIAAYVAAPSMTFRPLLDGLTGVGPGELTPLGEDAGPSVLIWAPAAFVRPERVDLHEAAVGLVRRVDACTASLVARHDRVLMELSGGLDSAIVAGALGATGLAPRVAQWLNRVGDRLEADESAYACAVTDRLGVSLTVENKPLSQITEASLAELASTLWPTISGADHGRDRDEVARLRDTGSDGIVSGQGGDAVFFQMPSVLVAVDAFRRDGVSVLSSPLLANVARRTGQSVWPVIKAILTDRLRGTPPPIDRSPFLTAAARESVRPEGHPWVRDAAARGAPPAKVLQIQAIANGHLLHGDSRRHREADLLYPLLAQPVVELCLSIAAPDLAGGAFDRPFARAAFASRIPDVIRNRRSKGNLDSFYSRMVAGSLDVLRPLLLDGCLCRAGILDREALDVALHPDRLIWTPRSIEVLWAATVETWAHHWQGQAPDSPRSPRRGP